MISEGEKIHVGVVGLDNWYHAFPYVELLSKSQRATLRAISDTNVDRLQWIGEHYDGIDLRDDHKSTLKDPAIDAVVITARTGMHVELALLAASEGKHVLCDKPLAIDSKEALRIAEAFRKTELVFAMNFPRRARPLYYETRRLLSEGIIGRPLSVLETGRFGFPSESPNTSAIGWYGERDQSGGGGFLDHAVHQIDMLRWLFSCDIESVLGTTAHLSAKDLDVEDYGIATLTLENGVVATIESSWMPPGYASDIIRIQGEKGVITLDVGKGTLQVDAPSLSTNQTYQPKSYISITEQIRIPLDGFGSVLDDMLDSVASHGSPLADVKDGYAATVVADAAFESARLGKRISCSC